MSTDGHGQPPIGDITSKPGFYLAYRAGLLGNRPQTWTVSELLAEADPPPVVDVRSADPRGGGGRTHLGCPLSTAIEIMAQSLVPMVAARPPAPDARRVFQGHISIIDGLYTLEYDDTPGLRLPEAAARFRAATGARARLLLRRYLDPASLEDLEDLLYMYAPCVVEFSTWQGTCGGLLRGRNTMIWEVRRY